MLWILTTSEDHVDENFYYLAGLSKEKHVSATLLVNGKNKLILTNRLEHGLFTGKKIIIERREQFEKILKKYSHHKVGMNLSYVSANSANKWKKLFKHPIADISKALEVARGIKTNSEIKKIKEACKITIETLDDIEKLLKKSRTEKDLATEFSYAAEKNGAEAISFPTIVASGKNSSLPHHSPTNQKLSKGLLLVDCGVVYDGYCSDITRTYHIGKSNEKAKKIYKIVHDAQQAGINKTKPNAKASDVHEAAASIIRKKLKQDMIHSFGHGLGIQVHDYPEGISSKSSVILKKNMVITAEPGFYDKNWGGIRIEDDLVVGSKPITKSSASLIEL